MLTEVGGTEIGSSVWTVTGGADGSVTGVVTDANSAGLAGSSNPRACVWYCKGSLSGDVVQFWGPSNSNFYIHQE